MQPAYGHICQFLVRTREVDIRKNEGRAKSVGCGQMSASLDQHRNDRVWQAGSMHTSFGEVSGAYHSDREFECCGLKAREND